MQVFISLWLLTYQLFCIFENMELLIFLRKFIFLLKVIFLLLKGSKAIECPTEENNKCESFLVRTPQRHITWCVPAPQSFNVKKAALQARQQQHFAKLCAMASLDPSIAACCWTWQLSAQIMTERPGKVQKLPESIYLYQTGQIPGKSMEDQN